MTLDELLQTLRRLETELHQAETRCIAARLSELLHPDFEEFGRSGRRYSRGEVLSEFSSNSEFPRVSARDFAVTQLAEGLALLTYRSAHVTASGALERHTLRSSLWVLKPRIRSFGDAYQERYQQILLDLDEYRREHPDAFGEGALVMDEEMRSRYLELISTGYQPS